MVAGAIAGNISAEATTPTGNTFAEAMRGMLCACAVAACQYLTKPHRIDVC